MLDYGLGSNAQFRHPMTRLATLTLFLTAAAAFSADRPNIVYILADDFGYGDARCYNPDGKVATPNIDRLAKDGMRFTDAHSGSAVCSPTRYGILTGRYAWRTKLLRGVLRPYDLPLIASDRLTVPALLKQQGYHTGCVGKWHLGWDWPKKDGTVVFHRPIANRRRWVPWPRCSTPTRGTCSSRSLDRGASGRGCDQSRAGETYLIERVDSTRIGPGRVPK